MAVRGNGNIEDVIVLEERRFVLEEAGENDSGRFGSDLEISATTGAASVVCGVIDVA